MADLEFFASPIFHPISSDAEKIDVKVGEDIFKYFMAVENISGKGIFIDNITFSGLPEGISVNTDEPFFTFLVGKYLAPGESLPEMYFKGKVSEKAVAAGESKVFKIAFGFRAKDDVTTKNISGLWFNMNVINDNPPSIFSKTVITLSIISGILLLLAVVLIIFFILKKRRQAATTFLTPTAQSDDSSIIANLIGVEDGGRPDFYRSRPPTNDELLMYHLLKID
jgi:hypothetical protein